MAKLGCARASRDTRMGLAPKIFKCLNSAPIRVANNTSQQERWNTKIGLIVESATSFKTKVNMAPIEPLPKQGTPPIAYRDCKNKWGTCDEQSLVFSATWDRDLKQLWTVHKCQLSWAYCVQTYAWINDNQKSYLHHVYTLHLHHSTSIDLGWSRTFRHMHISSPCRLLAQPGHVGTHRPIRSISLLQHPRDHHTDDHCTSPRLGCVSKCLKDGDDMGRSWTIHIQLLASFNVHFWSLWHFFEVFGCN